jgi:hypothetical protein
VPQEGGRLVVHFDIDWGQPVIDQGNALIIQEVGQQALASFGCGPASLVRPAFLAGDLLLGHVCFGLDAVHILGNSVPDAVKVDAEGLPQNSEGGGKAHSIGELPDATRLVLANPENMSRLGTEFEDGVVDINHARLDLCIVWV